MLKTRMQFDDYLDVVLYTVVEVTGHLVEVDQVPYKAVLFHWQRGDSPYLAADTITWEV